MSAWEDVEIAPISAGPIIGEGAARPAMFYNGATQDAAWRIGWATFDASLTELAERCEEPLVCPEKPLSAGSTDILFAASAVERDDKVLLYYSQSDQDPRCAAIRHG